MQNLSTTSLYIEAHLVSRAWRDPQFLRLLEENSQQALAEFDSRKLPADCNIELVVEKEGEWIILLPESPPHLDGLDKKDLFGSLLYFARKETELRLIEAALASNEAQQLALHTPTKFYAQVVGAPLPNGFDLSIRKAPTNRPYAVIPKLTIAENPPSKDDLEEASGFTMAYADIIEFDVKGGELMKTPILG